MMVALYRDLTVADDGEGNDVAFLVFVEDSD